LLLQERQSEITYLPWKVWRVPPAGQELSPRLNLFRGCLYSGWVRRCSGSVELLVYIVDHCCGFSDAIVSLVSERALRSKLFDYLKRELPVFLSVLGRNVVGVGWRNA
jgi:hypothetical protein